MDAVALSLAGAGAAGIATKRRRGTMLGAPGGMTAGTAGDTATAGTGVSGPGISMPPDTGLAVEASGVAVIPSTLAATPTSMPNDREASTESDRITLAAPEGASTQANRLEITPGNDGVGNDGEPLAHHSNDEPHLPAVDTPAAQAQLPSFLTGDAQTDRPGGPCHAACTGRAR